MSDLQITLIALGIVIILCVLIYNWWQERKFRLDMASNFIEPKQDALIDDFEMNADAFEGNEIAYPSRIRVEPNIDSLKTPTFNEEVFDEELIEIEFVTESTVAADEEREEQATFDKTTQDWSHLDDFAKPELTEHKFIAPNFLDEESEPASNSTKVVPDAAELEETIEKVLELTAQTASIELPAAIDTKVDLVAILTLEKDLANVKLNYALNDFVDFMIEFDKHVHAYSLNDSDTWDSISTDSILNKHSKQLAFSLQLVDRSGAVNRAMLNRFQHAVELLGLELGSQVEWLNHEDPLHFAQQLDQFCIEVDKIISFHLVQGEHGPFHGTKLRGLAEANGFSLGADGAFHFKDSRHLTASTEENAPLFTITNQHSQPFTVENLRSIVIKGITFQMDIPRVKNSVEVFSQMLAVAQKIQSGVSAQLVDDLQKPLTELQITKICQQLETIQTKMLTYGIAPGSVTALRLFS